MGLFKSSFIASKEPVIIASMSKLVFADGTILSRVLTADISRLSPFSAACKASLEKSSVLR